MNCIFIHIPKNGGLSISKFLQQANCNCITMKHGSASFVLDKIGPKRFHNRFSFAFVRNPWDRLVSLFLFNKTQWVNKKARNPKLKMPIYYKKNDFIKFIHVFLENHYKKLTIHHQIPNAPQMDWLTDKDGTILVDFVGRLENFENDMKVVKKELGIDFQLSLPYINKTSQIRKKAKGKESYRQYYNKEIRNLVAEAFSKDIEAFEYTF